MDLHRNLCLLIHWAWISGVATTQTKKKMKTDIYPEVALIIAAYNEADLIVDKAMNCLAQHYPKEKLKIKFVTDGSTDGTNYLLSAIQGIEVYHQDQRRGKLAAVERIIEQTSSPIIILTDANCFLNHDAVKNIVKHYQHPKVGGVSGEKKIRKDLTVISTSGAGEGIYWKYESWLKAIDSQFNTVVGAAGELFSFRRSLYESLSPDTLIEDFVLSMRIAMKGYRIAYEPNAFAIEAPSFSLKEEWKRKVRICAGGFQSLQYLPGILNPFRYGLLTFQFISHRWLRWAISPFLIPVIILLTGMLASNDEFYITLFAMELIGLTLAITTILISEESKFPKIFRLPGYILMMNAAAYAGLIKYWKGSQSVIWEKAKRHQL